MQKRFVTLRNNMCNFLLGINPATKAPVIYPTPGKNYNSYVHILLTSCHIHYHYTDRYRQSASSTSIDIPFPADNNKTIIAIFIKNF